MIKFLNEAVGIKFFNLLSTHPTFQNNWKAIAPSYYCLQRVAKYVKMNDGKLTEISWDIFDSIFKAHGKYTEFLSALEELMLLEIDHSFHFTVGEHTGKCKSYKVTELALDLLIDSSKEYLKKLHGDKKTIRSNQKSISKRKVMKKHYDDIIIDRHHTAMINISVDIKDQETLIENCESKLKRDYLIDTLLNIVTKKHFDSFYCLKNGRLINAYTNIPNDIKNTMKITKDGKILKRKVVVDIRSCHPTFFSTFIMNKLVLNADIYLGNTNIDNIPYTSIRPHILGHWRQLYGDTKEINVNNLIEEHKKWLKLYLDKDNDPKSTLAELLGKDKTYIKKAMIETLNGNYYYTDYLNYLVTEFPNLMYAWLCLGNMELTGQEISKEYESAMTLDKQLYEFADIMGVVLLYENDGFSIYGEEKEDLLSKVNFLVQYMSFTAYKKWGVIPFIKIMVSI